MKLLLILSMFLFSFSLFAQDTWDFETTAQDTGWSVFDGTKEQFSVVPNPDMSGLNTTANVAKLVVDASADPWAGIFNNKITPFVVTAQNAHPTLLVYKDHTSLVDFKYEYSGVSSDHFDSSTVVNQWQKMTFDFSADIGKTVTTITVIPDFSPIPRTYGSTNYFDMIEFVQGGVPVELVSFSASVINNEVHLSWNTASEKNNSGFEVERSADSKTFSKIGFVQGRGTSSEANVYSYVDKDINSKMYYRLKQVDFDGTYKYSKTVEVSSLSPVQFNLSQNYPNPFNPSTIISYSIPQDNFVSLKVYNVLGNEVATLVNGQITAGTHNVHFNASSLSSGVYYYTLRTGNFTNTKKLMLLK